jgi:hypothetical protein
MRQPIGEGPVLQTIHVHRKALEQLLGSNAQADAIVPCVVAAGPKLIPMRERYTFGALFPPITLPLGNSLCCPVRVPP